MTETSKKPLGQNKKTSFCTGSQRDEQKEANNKDSSRYEPHVTSYQPINWERTMGDITRCHFSCSYQTNNNIILFRSNSSTLSHSVERLLMLRAAIREDLIAGNSPLNHITMKKTCLLGSVLIIFIYFSNNSSSILHTFTTVCICATKTAVPLLNGVYFRKRREFQWI